MEKGGSSTTTVGFTKAVGIVTSARERAICETLTRHSCTWESFLKVSAGVMGVKYVQMEPSTSETGAMVSVKVGARRHTQTGAYTAASGKAVRDMVQAFSQLRTGHAMRVNGTSTASTGMGTWSERTAPSMRGFSGRGLYLDKERCTQPPHSQILPPNAEYGCDRAQLYR